MKYVTRTRQIKFFSPQFTLGLGVGYWLLVGAVAIASGWIPGLFFALWGGGWSLILFSVWDESLVNEVGLRFGFDSAVASPKLALPDGLHEASTTPARNSQGNGAGA